MEKAVCAVCGGEFTPKRIGHGICSDACRKAARGTTYRQARLEAFYRDCFACTTCGSPEHLECHHIVMVSLGGGHDLDNLLTLCRACHKAIHKALRAKQKEEYGAQENDRRGGESYDRAA